MRKVEETVSILPVEVQFYGAELISVELSLDGQWQKLELPVAIEKEKRWDGRIGQIWLW